MNGLDLFSGIGGISLALKPWVRTIAYCEIDRYCQGVLLSRMQSGDLDKAPICEDVRSLKGEMLPEIDIITAGFPCQDISSAGSGAGLAGGRSGLFFEVVRITKEIRPSFVFLENVPAIRTRGLEQVVKEFAEIRYDCRWTCITASSVGALHKRERWFLLAHKTFPNPFSERLERNYREKQSHTKPSEFIRNKIWEIEPKLDRVVNGLPFRVDRIKSLGNSVVPLQAQAAFERLLKCVG